MKELFLRRLSAMLIFLGLSSAKDARRFKLSLLVLTLILAIPVVSCWAQSSGKCVKCGMDLSKYPHTKYVVMTTDGQEHPTCGVQCGLSLHVRFQDKWKSAKATDILSNRPFEAGKGFYVHKSSVITDMAPGFIAFNLRPNAERFSQGFGGQVVTYEEALEIWKKRMK
jgi:nitrous oxide reductase accessory protein NosL